MAAWEYSQCNIQLSFCSSNPRVVQSHLSMPWPTTCSVSLQPGACMELAMSQLLTMLPTPRLWQLCRRTRRWPLRRTAATQATPCPKPFPQQPSNCLSMTSIRHIDCDRVYSSSAVRPVMWGCHLNSLTKRMSFYANFRKADNDKRLCVYVPPTIVLQPHASLNVARM